MVTYTRPFHYDIYFVRLHSIDLSHDCVSSLTAQFSFGNRGQTHEMPEKVVPKSIPTFNR